MLDVVRKKQRKHRTGKVVVYGNSVPKIKALAKKLGCDAYHHDAVGKASMLANFTAGKKRVIAATSALGWASTYPTSGASSTSTGRSACWTTRRRAGGQGETGCKARR
jgi:hypothetical protein